MMRRDDAFPLGALAVLIAATLLWWAFALWPVPSGAAPWLERARFVCFNAAENGLPERSGWILLIGQPIGMLALLMAGWGPRVRQAVLRLVSFTAGRVVAAGTVLVLVAGMGAAGVRVVGAEANSPTLPGIGMAESHPRLDRPWPSTAGLVDQSGTAFNLASLQAAPALVTFGFAHCETICPMLVASALAAREALSGTMELRVVVVTLDPWRDTPSRLPTIAREWGLGPDDLLLGGSVTDVEAALTAWGVQRVRNTATGDIAHPPLAFLVEADGTVAYASNGSPEQLERLARRLRRFPPAAMLSSLAAQLDSLESAVEEDDAWLGRNARVLEGYGQHEEYALRLTLRGRRAASHAALLDRYQELRDELQSENAAGPRDAFPARQSLPVPPGRT